MRSIILWVVMLTALVGMVPSVSGQTMDDLDVLHATSNSSFLRQRMRKMKFTNLRLTALQLDLPVEDETNFIGLDNWADNYAGLTQDIRPRAQLLGGYSGFSASPKAESLTGGSYIAGRVDGNALEGEGYYERHRGVDGAASKEEPSLAAAYGTSLGHWLLGLGGGVAHDKFRDSSYEDYLDRTQFDAGVGRVFFLSRSTLTLGASFGADFDQERYGSDETSLGGARIGFQGIWQYPEGALGLRFNTQTISGQEKYPAAAHIKPLYIYDDKKIRDEAGVRWLHKFQSIPFNIGAEWMFAQSIREDTLTYPSSLSNYQKSTEIYNGLGIGLVWRVTPKALLGAEFQNTRIDYKWNSEVSPYINIQMVSVGTEFPLLTNLVSRFSYKQTICSEPGIEVFKIHGLGAGIGYQFSDSLKADLAYNHNILKIGMPTWGHAGTENAVKLQLSWHFRG